MTKGLNKQVEAFRNRSLSQHLYPVLWVDALYKKVRMDGRIVSMAVLVVCGVDEHGQRDIELMPEESEDTYLLLFRDLQERGLRIPRGAPTRIPALWRQFGRAFPVQAGRDVKCTSWATFWRMCPIRRKIRLLNN